MKYEGGRMNSTQPENLRERTKRYALHVLRLYTLLPKTAEAQILGKQLLRSGTSVGTHYREANRAKSNADFISKIEGALQELDESDYWLELLYDGGLFTDASVQELRAETNELISIFVTLVKKAKAR